MEFDTSPCRLFVSHEQQVHYKFKLVHSLLGQELLVVLKRLLAYQRWERVGNLLPIGALKLQLFIVSATPIYVRVEPFNRYHFLRQRFLSRDYVLIRKLQTFNAELSKQREDLLKCLGLRLQILLN